MFGIGERAIVFTGTVVSDVGKGCWFIEQDHTRDCVFVHQRHVVRRKFLHLNDRVKFNLAPNVLKPGEIMAVDVEIIGLMIARQVSGPAVQS
jgi:cold shock CspA family protein